MLGPHGPKARKLGPEHVDGRNFEALDTAGQPALLAHCRKFSFPLGLRDPP